ncbi:tRNA nucleotidyltransferase [Microdochium bolleyi]|uniref:tRNA nucleotidyltransferase n=1 Tax=Microdochium bolleyi TaxID=196109 RepID=A0A136JDH2_9PEZI|nr:tRNA nucleotidyltransferase [Microdochium bolleyi]
MYRLLRPRIFDTLAPAARQISAPQITGRILAHYCCTHRPMPKRMAEDSLEGYHLSQRSTQIRKMATGSAITPTTTTKAAAIELTEKESQLRNLLLDVARSINKSNTQNDDPSTTTTTAEPVVLRWAGGWVRDKLLGTESVDIDTAINTMTGEAFALRLCELCSQDPATIARHAISQSDIGNLHKIARNPDKSKHLETTTIRLFGLDVDFVNLRRETYTSDSRNPQMEFGTAEEDALRRDATVNALFYNLESGEVEDFTTGLEDMRRRLIRTPLEPFQTFTDDPLRVLRLVRFASRLEFSIDPAVEEVMGDERVLEALRVKISRERVGVELEKMLKGKHPREALEYIERLGLYHAIFTDPTAAPTASPAALPKPDTTKWSVAYTLLSKLAALKTPGSIYDVLVRHDEAAYYAWTLAALVPWEATSTAYTAANPHTGPGKTPPPLVTLAAREGIRTPTRFCDLATAAHSNRAEIMRLKGDVAAARQPRCGERDTFGMAIRRWDARGGHWRLQVLYALLAEAMEVLPLPITITASTTSTSSASTATTTTTTSTTPPQPLSEQETAFLTDWQRFLDHLHELDVLEAPTLKRLIDGTQLAKALGVKPGRWMTGALDVCVAWQLRHPEATDPQGAVDEVEARRAELGIPERK